MENGALVIRRKPGNTVLVGDDIRITITKIENGWADVRVEAPKDIRIQREENSIQHRNGNNGKGFAISAKG